MTLRGNEGTRHITTFQRQSSQNDDAQTRWRALLSDDTTPLPMEDAFSLSCAFVDRNGTRTSLR